MRRFRDDHLVCQAKNIYPTKGEAVRVSKIQRRRGAPLMTVYQCEICGGWHLTKQGWSKNKRRK